MQIPLAGARALLLAAQGIFEVRQLHLEPGVAVTDGLVTALGGALRDCAAWHETPQVVIRQSEPPELALAVEYASAA